VSRGGPCPLHYGSITNPAVTAFLQVLLCRLGGIVYGHTSRWIARVGPFSTLAVCGSKQVAVTYVLVSVFCSVAVPRIYN
jgi:hypothetical protein